MTETILATEAHCDDLAWRESGTVARWTNAGHTVDSVVFTDSNFRGDGTTRKKEQIRMMENLGMRYLFAVGETNKWEDGKLHLADFGQLVQAGLHIVDLAEQRGEPITIMTTFDNHENKRDDDGLNGWPLHRDHLVVARIARELFAMRTSIRELWHAAMPPDQWKLFKDAYNGTYMEMEIPDPPDMTGYKEIDIGNTYFRKEEAIRAHRSQLDIDGRSHLKRIRQARPVEMFNIFTRG